MFSPIPPPTPKSQILCRILIILAILTMAQALFLMFTYGYKSITYLISFLIYIISVCKLSYFGCIINQCICISLIWFLLLEVSCLIIFRWQLSLKKVFTKYILVAKVYIKCHHLYSVSCVYTSILWLTKSSNKLLMKYFILKIISVIS